MLYPDKIYQYEFDDKKVYYHLISIKCNNQERGDDSYDLVNASDICSTWGPILTMTHYKIYKSSSEVDTKQHTIGIGVGLREDAGLAISNASKIASFFLLILIASSIFFSSMILYRRLTSPEDWYENRFLSLFDELPIVVRWFPNGALRI